jgi:hypothetical protein
MAGDKLHPGDQVWISGGIALEGIALSSFSNNANILVADLSPLLKDKPLPKVFIINRRYIRAHCAKQNGTDGQFVVQDL